MRSTLTPGAERALAAAAVWISSDESDELGLPEVLLGLLDEPECRAALLLAEHQIDVESVRQKFPQLRELSPAAAAHRPYSREFSHSLRTVETLLIEYPQPLELATEHLLLGIVATESDVSRWLAEQGLQAESLEARVHVFAGHRPGPLPLDPLEIEPLPSSLGTMPRTRPVGSSATESDRLAAMRIVDAAANRAGEGLRVIEDYLRFQLDDRHLTQIAKAIRHELTEALRVYDSAARHAARETQADVGTAVSLPSEAVRSSLAEVLAASFKRVEQSLRSLEEYSKTLAAEVAGTLEQLRYRVYTLERATEITRNSLSRLADARLYVLIDGGKSAEQLRSLAIELVAAGVSVLQLRDKQLPDRELVARARLLRDVTRDSATLFIVNDRPDLAVLSGADGVHVGQEELSVKDARRIIGSQGLVGVSTHSIEQARAAVLDGADYLGVGPTFPSGTKAFREFTGVELLRAVASEIQLPAFAIGGVTAANVAQVRQAGVTRIAVSGAVTGASQPAAAARELSDLLVG